MNQGLITPTQERESCQEKFFLGSGSSWIWIWRPVAEIQTWREVPAFMNPIVLNQRATYNSQQDLYRGHGMHGDRVDLKVTQLKYECKSLQRRK